MYARDDVCPSCRIADYEVNPFGSVCIRGAKGRAQRDHAAQHFKVMKNFLHPLEWRAFGSEAEDCQESGWLVGEDPPEVPHASFHD